MITICAICGKPTTSISITGITLTITTGTGTTTSFPNGGQITLDGYCQGHPETMWPWYPQGLSSFPWFDPGQPVSPLPQQDLTPYLEAFEGDPAFDLGKED